MRLEAREGDPHELGALAAEPLGVGAPRGRGEDLVEMVGDGLRPEGGEGLDGEGHDVHVAAREVSCDRLMVHDGDAWRQSTQHLEAVRKVLEADSQVIEGIPSDCLFFVIEFEVWHLIIELFVRRRVAGVCGDHQGGDLRHPLQLLGREGGSLRGVHAPAVRRICLLLAVLEGPEAGVEIQLQLQRFIDFWRGAAIGKLLEPVVVNEVARDVTHPTHDLSCHVARTRSIRFLIAGADIGARLTSPIRLLPSVGIADPEDPVVGPAATADRSEPAPRVILEGRIHRHSFLSRRSRAFARFFSSLALELYSTVEL